MERLCLNSHSYIGLILGSILGFCEILRGDS